MLWVDVQFVSTPTVNVSLCELWLEVAYASVARLAGCEFDCAGKIGLGGWTKFWLVWGQFSRFQASKLYSLIS